MPAFIGKDGAAVEVFPGLPFVDRDEIQRPGNWLELASPQELAGAKIREDWPVEPPAPPAGKVVVLGPPVVEGEQVVRSYTLEDASPPAPIRYQIAKADIWRRATDAEADAMDAALNAAPVRLRRTYSAAQYIDSGDEWFPELEAGIAAAVGPERAAELLAPAA